MNGFTRASTRLFQQILARIQRDAADAVDAVYEGARALSDRDVPPDVDLDTLEGDQRELMRLCRRAEAVHAELGDLAKSAHRMATHWEALARNPNAQRSSIPDDEGQTPSKKEEN